MVFTLTRTDKNSHLVRQRLEKSAPCVDERRRGAEGREASRRTLSLALETGLAGLRPPPGSHPELA